MKNFKTNADLLHETYQPESRNIEDTKQFKAVLVLVYGVLIAGLAIVSIIFFNGNFHFGGF